MRFQKKKKYNKGYIKTKICNKFTRNDIKKWITATGNSKKISLRKFLHSKRLERMCLLCVSMCEMATVGSEKFPFLTFCSSILFVGASVQLAWTI